MEEDNILRKCDKCKIIKPKRQFFRYKYCKKCHIKSYINQHLLNAHIANHLNLSINEINDIMTSKKNDPLRNEIGEHERYDEIIMYYTGHSMPKSTIITENVIDKFLDEIF